MVAPYSWLNKQTRQRKSSVEAQLASTHSQNRASGLPLARFSDQTHFNTETLYENLQLHFCLRKFPLAS